MFSNLIQFVVFLIFQPAVHKKYTFSYPFNITFVLRFLNLILMVFQPADHSRAETKQVSLAGALYKRRELVN